MTNRKKKKRKHLQIDFVRKSIFSQLLTQTLVVKIGVGIGILSFLLLFAPIFTKQTGKIAVIMFGVRGCGFALLGAVSAWIILLLAGHIWDIRPVGPDEREKFLLDFLKRSGMCLVAIFMLSALAAAGLYFGSDNVKKAVTDYRSDYIEASGLVSEAYYDHYRHGPGEYKYRVTFDHVVGGEFEFSEIIFAVYRRIRASNTGNVLRTGDYGIIYFYPQTQVIDHVIIF